MEFSLYKIYAIKDQEFKLAKDHIDYQSVNTEQQKQSASEHKSALYRRFQYKSQKTEIDVVKINMISQLE